MIAKKLIEEYGFTQQNAALKLGMTQSAISFYLGKKRGTIIKINEEMDRLAEGVAKSIYEGKMTQDEFIMQLCNICMKYRGDDAVCRKR